MSENFIIDGEIKVEDIRDVIFEDPNSALMEILVDRLQVTQIPTSVERKEKNDESVSYFHVPGNKPPPDR